MIASVLCRRRGAGRAARRRRDRLGLRRRQARDPRGRREPPGVPRPFPPGAAAGKPARSSASSRTVEGYVVSADLVGDQRPLRGGGREAPTSLRRSSTGSSSRMTASGASCRIRCRASSPTPGDATSVLEIEDYHQTLVIDPALAWWTRRRGERRQGQPQTRGAAEARPDARFRLAQGRLRHDRQRRRHGLQHGQAGDRATSPSRSRPTTRTASPSARAAGSRRRRSTSGSTA